MVFTGATAMSGKRVCVIGSGPSGMAFLYHIEKLRLEGSAVPDVVCYDKQSDWGGLWNYDWRTGRTMNETPEKVTAVIY